MVDDKTRIKGHRHHSSK